MTTDAKKHLIDFAFDANCGLQTAIQNYENARNALTKEREQQSIAIRALAAIDADADPVKYGRQLEVRAIHALWPQAANELD